MFGAEALVESYIGYLERNNPDPVGVERSDDTRPFNPGNALAYGGRYAGEFGAYQEFASMMRDRPAGQPPRLPQLRHRREPGRRHQRRKHVAPSDGNDRPFGDFGNDSIVAGTGEDSAINSGQFTVSGEAYQVSPTKLGSDAAAAFNIAEWLTHFELKVSIVAGKPTGVTSPTPT